MVKIPLKPETKITQPQIKTIALDVGGMKCAGCVKAVEKQLQQNLGVRSACVNLITEVAVVEYESEKLVPETLADKLTQGGFPSQVRVEDRSIAEVARQAQSKREQQQRQQLWQLITAIILLVFSSIGHLHHLGLTRIPVLSNIWFHWGLATLALLIPGRSLILDGAKSLSHRMPNMNTLIGLGTVSAYLASCVALLFPGLGWECFFDEPVMLLGFIFLGRTLEARARNRASLALENLVSLQPQIARLVAQQEESNSIGMEIPVEQVKVGDWLRVLPGEKIPVDGILVRGETTIDESMLTGESIPIAKAKDDRLLAGTINQSGTILLQVQNTGKATTLAKIINLVESAQTRKAPVQQLADTVAGYFAYGVMAIAGLTFLFWYFLGTKIWSEMLSTTAHSLGGEMIVVETSPVLLSLKLTIAVLAIACPCALGLATPTAILVGTSIGAEQGILIKGGDVLEKISKLDTIVFDKTGTLTLGKLTVTDCVALDNSLTATDLLQIAASLENQSNHPLAKAIITQAEQQNLALLPVSEITHSPGLGLKGIVAGATVYLGNPTWISQQGISLDSSVDRETQVLEKAGKTIVYLAKNRVLIGYLALKDNLRHDATQTVSQLQNLGLNVILLTGDRSEVAQAIAKPLNITQVFAEVKPEQKADVIKSLQNSASDEAKQLNNSATKIVAMLGDGINDAPALAQADIGVSLQGSTDIAIETADVVLMQNKLADLINAIELSLATTNKIKQNLAWALAYNVIAIPIAAGVLIPSFNLVLSPVIAAIAMASSSLIVVSNSLLLLQQK
ncbi:MAG TPA: heavy metal translocating P-type ATPase [Xenococcaceae cyanobacterium]